MHGPNALLAILTFPPGALPNQARIVIDGTRGAIFEYATGGALVSSWASTAGTDPYGNAYPAGFNAGSNSQFSGQNFIIDSQGVFIYSDPPGPGNLVAYWTVKPGTDQFGNQYSAGLVMGAPGSSQVAISPSNPAFQGVGTTTFSSGASDEGTPLGIYAQYDTTGTSPFIDTVVQGPANAKDPNRAFLAVTLNSASDDASAGTPSTQTTLAVTDAFQNLYMAFSNTGDGSQIPSIAIGEAVPGTNLPADLSSAFIQMALNGCIATYGTSTGGSITKTYTANGTFIPPTGVTQVAVNAWAGGAGGQWASGPGGGGGEYAGELNNTVVAGSSYPITVGAGGNGGTSSSGTGKAGSNSTFSGPSAITVTANGAPLNNSAHANGGNGSTNSVHTPGGGGNSSSTGPGQGGGGGGGAGGTISGGGGSQANSGAQPGSGGNGGNSGGGGGGGGGWGNSGTSGSTPGSNGGTPGGGGGAGGATSGGGSNGGNGARGLVTVTYSLPSSTIIASSLASASGTDLKGNPFPAGYMGKTTAVDPVNGGPETWHNMTLINGWTIGTGGYAQYKLGPDNRVYLRGYKVAPGTLTSFTTIWNIQTGYIPTVTAIHLRADIENTTGSLSGDTPRLDAMSVGTLQIVNIPSGTTFIGFNGSYPLD